MPQVCQECEQLLDQYGHCINVNCPEGQRHATAGAARTTAKATAAAAGPSAWGVSGRPD